MTTLRMPDLGTVEGSVTLVRWLKREGDAVSLGEPLFEVETDKGVSEVECAADGVLAARLVAEGASVAAGDPIASVQGKGEIGQVLPSPPPRGPSARQAPEAVAVPRASSGPRPVSRGPTPVIAALAAKHGVDLSRLEGTGPGGAITRQDVLRVRDTGRTAQSVVAAKVSQSHREKPVFHVTARVDMGRVIAAREAARDAAHEKLSYTAFFVKACAAAIGEQPSFRRFISGHVTGLHEAVDIAVAIGIDDDLYAPAVRGVDTRSIGEISADIQRLSDSARLRSLAAADSQGSCFLVSSLGMYPAVESFDAVILPEHAAALAVGAVVSTPVADAAGGAGIRTAPLASLTLSADHRLINGGAAARFLGRVKQYLEEGGWA